MAALGGSSLNAAAAATGAGPAVSGGVGSPGAAINAAPAGRASPMPDLSHLTDEERRIIEQVLLRQRREEEQETEIVR